MKLEYRRLERENAHRAGRALLEQMYCAAMGQPMPEICLQPLGKPYFASGDVHFSISHTKKHVFCVLSDSPVGVDAEEQDRQIDLRLAQRILSPDEQARFDAAADKRQCLLRLWVLKEAAAKCTGKGLQGYPNHTDFCPDDPRIQTIDGCYVAVIEDRR